MADAVGQVTFSTGGERWIEFGPPGERRRVGFHDYAALYAVPGLYERAFYEGLGMRSAFEVVRALGDALAAHDVDPRGLRALDFGAGNGMGGEALRALGVPAVVGVDLEPVAREAAIRDRPAVYEDFLVADLGALGDDELDALRARGFDVLLAVAALGFGHVPALVLERAIGLVRPGGWVAFAIAVELTPGEADDAGRETGYPALLEALFGQRGAQRSTERTYVHRRSTDGAEQPARAIVARLPG